MELKNLDADFLVQKSNNRYNQFLNWKVTINSWVYEWLACNYNNKMYFADVHKRENEQVNIYLFRKIFLHLE